MTDPVWPGVGYLPLIATVSLVLAGRQSGRALAIVSAVLLAASVVLWLRVPSVGVAQYNAVCTAGYDSWAIASSMASCVAVIGLWQRLRKPGVVAGVVGFALSFFVMQLGAWIT